jgi:predicted RNA polymerase sigma factor
VQRWPAEGVPEYPRGWLIRVGYRRMVDLLRSDQARRTREMTSAATEEPMQTAEPADETDETDLRCSFCAAIRRSARSLRWP